MNFSDHASILDLDRTAQTIDMLWDHRAVCAAICRKNVILL